MLLVWVDCLIVSILRSSHGFQTGTQTKRFPSMVARLAIEVLLLAYVCSVTYFFFGRKL